jgi:hypothetical protein
MMRSVCLMTIECAGSHSLSDTIGLLNVDESVQERVVREIRMLRAMRRALETGLRNLLTGHEGGNAGDRQGDP